MLDYEATKERMVKHFEITYFASSLLDFCLLCTQDSLVKIIMETYPKLLMSGLIRRPEYLLVVFYVKVRGFW
jgi:hypothetical protein